MTLSLQDHYHVPDHRSWYDLFCTLNQLNKVWHVWPGSNDFHWMCQTNWPVELDLEELFFHVRAKGNEIEQHSSRDRTPVDHASASLESENMRP